MRGDFEKIEFNEFLSLSKHIQKENEEKNKHDFICASYTAYQLGAGGEKKCNSFGDYLSSLGLGTKKPKLTNVQKKKIASKGVQTAQRILKMKIRKRDREKTI